MIPPINEIVLEVIKLVRRLYKHFEIINTGFNAQNANIQAQPVFRTGIKADLRKRSPLG